MEKKTAAVTATDSRVYIGARIDKDTKEKLEAKANKARRSLSAEIAFALEFWADPSAALEQRP